MGVSSILPLSETQNKSTQKGISYVQTMGNSRIPELNKIKKYF